MDYGLCYRAEDLTLIGYTDSEFRADKNIRESTSDYMFTLSSVGILWGQAYRAQVPSYTTFVQDKEVVVVRILSAQDLANPFD